MQSNHRLLVLKFLAIVGALALGLSICSAQEYPTRAIDMIAPFTPGGGTDTFCRHIQEPLSKELKVSVNIVNRPGGSSVIGSSFVANARRDGYTILGHDINILLMTSAALAKSVPYDVLKDFTPIVQIAVQPMVIYVRSDSEFKTLEELVSFAKKNPGKLLAGATGVATQNRINLELLKLSTGIDFRFVFFDGGGDTLLSVLGGHTNFSNSPYSTCDPHIKAGKLRPLAVCTPQRTPSLPQIRTTQEIGFPEININQRFGLLGPKGLPSKITERLSDGANAILKSQELRAVFQRFEYSVNYSGAKQLGENWAGEFKVFKDIVQKAKLEE